MEHDSLDSGLRALAALNLSETYLALGRASPGSKVLETRSFVACTGSVPHPVCNFAVRLARQGEGLEELAAIARSRPAFNIYATPAGGSNDVAERLVDAGFRCAYSLRMMGARGMERAGAELALRRCEPGERMETAVFMMSEFFGRGSARSREAVAQATAWAETLELHRLHQGRSIAAAVMLSRTEGSVGIYNLCVRGDLRGRGWGSAVVRKIIDLEPSDRLVTLQCDPSLAAWYSGLGFDDLGPVNVFVWDRSPILL